MDIPFDRLDIPESYRPVLTEAAAVSERIGLAHAELPAEAELGVLYVLACEETVPVREAALARLRSLPGAIHRIGQRTHPKVLELLVSIRSDLDDRVCEIRDANLRTFEIMAARADAHLCERILEDHERLLFTPDVVTVLRANPACPPAALERAISFLRMNRTEIAETPGSPSAADQDVLAEIEAALRGEASPHLQRLQLMEAFDVDRFADSPLEGFSFDFADEDAFSLDLLEDRQGNPSDETRRSIEKIIAELSVGKKIKLAYLGNKESRAVLIRDRSKMVAQAVVRSGRLTDGEVVSFAGNRNMHAEVLRELAMNREYMRKYPVQVALVNNPRTPVPISIGLVDRMLGRDLDTLARNRNVSSVVFQKAEKLRRLKASR